MKKIFFSAASAALLLLTGCQREQLPVSPQGPGEFVKTISVSLGDPSTRAASALSGEGAIEDATLFVWQHNASTDETVLYQKTYAASSSFEFSLLFSDQTDYTYSINAWANMGELGAEPVDGEVLFTGESASGLQMKGSKGSIDESSSSAVTIDMKRYVGKITVAEVALEWTNAQNALQEFTLKSIYVANAGDKAEGAVATYNVDGAYVSSSMDALLYSPVNSVIADGGKYETAQMMYAYGSGSTALVLECELGGQTMYYHVPYEPGWNTHRVFRFTVRQAGSDDPMGELPEEAIEVSVTTLNVLDWDADEQESDFGEKPEEPALVRIQHIDGELYSINEWTSIGFTSEQANGVYVSDGTHEFVIHPTKEFTYNSSSQWASTTNSFYLKLVPDVLCTEDELIAQSDFEGVTNTYKIIEFSHRYNGVATSCRSVDFENGYVGYLPAAGEMWLCYSNIELINECLRTINGIELSGTYWTSTQFSDSKAWVINKSLTLSSKDKYLSNSMLAPKTRVFGSMYRGDENLPELPPYSTYILEGVPMILATDNTYYTVDGWRMFGKGVSEPVGVALSDGIHSFLIHPTAELELEWSANNVRIPGVGSNSESDYCGVQNTQIILNAVASSLIENAPAATFCSETVFANGKTGYLPGTGEFLMAYDYEVKINECLEEIGGTLLFKKNYWTSTQYDASHSYYWWTNYKGTSFESNNTLYFVRPFATLSGYEAQ